MTKELKAAIKKNHKLLLKETAEFKKKCKKNIPIFRELAENGGTREVRNLAKRWLALCEEEIKK